MARAILLHAWLMISADWSKTIRLVVVPWMAAVGVFLGIAQAAVIADNPAALSVLAVPLMIMGITVYLWVLVGWHRYVLLGEDPQGVGPAWRGSENLAYLGWAILVGLIIAIPAAILEGIGLSWLSSNGAVYVIYEAAVFLVWGYISLRISLVLPSAAIGGEMSIRLSWQKTAEISSTLWALSAVMAGLYLVADLIRLAIAGYAIGEVIGLTAHAAIGLLGVSILTTLYGILVEGRSLDQ